MKGSCACSQSRIGRGAVPRLPGTFRRLAPGTVVGCPLGRVGCYIGYYRRPAVRRVGRNHSRFWSGMAANSLPRTTAMLSIITAAKSGEVHRDNSRQCN